MAQNLFGDEDPTGTEIRIRNHVFKVLGVMAPKGASTQRPESGRPDLRAVHDRDEEAPGQRVPELHPGVGALGRTRCSAPPRPSPRPCAVEHKIETGADDDFRVQTQDDLIATRTQATQTMTSLLAGIAAVSLLVGGIGIMNIMLVSVTERTREIGLRLAIGASGSDVLMQFLVEAVVISLVGGFLGIALGYGVVGVRARLPAVADAGAERVGLHVRGLLGRRRNLLRVLSRQKSRGARSDRSAAVRIEYRREPGSSDRGPALLSCSTCAT